ncbi:patatin-like phospholipase family protein [Saccharopolyspora sp. HNM0983]|uniref:Patatin-like phospholipase family protein n=1 Tax=Saccharopolyspora montiporae TaxID=2781240 RepID=A0A929B9J8_9PSEU|nr:patatin-like phospholipase family protein [Saccharopolyspora sp. HNM0983]MBE9375782.1 patatin-like phospholipase family protein [Saccharopolyspora sp. HNM0983]
MRTAWVLPGGSTFGAIQSGLVTALIDGGVEPDLLVGTSVGSLNAAWLAGDPSTTGAARLRELWTRLRRTDVFPIQPLRILAGKMGLSNHVMTSHGLADWLNRTLPYRRLEHAAVPLTVTATDVDNGDPVYFERGPALPALVASCSIPGMFPPVQVAGRWLVDGGPAAFMPVSRAVERGADRVFVLPCGGTEPFVVNRRKTRGIGAIATWPPPKSPPRSVGGVNGAALGAAMVSAARLDLQLNAARCDLYVLPAPSVVGLSPYSFEHVGELMDASFEIASRWLPEARPVPRGPVDIGGNPSGGNHFGVSTTAQEHRG